MSSKQRKSVKERKLRVIWSILASAIRKWSQPHTGWSIMFTFRANIKISIICDVEICLKPWVTTDFKPRSGRELRYVASSDNSLPTFRNNPSVTFSRPFLKMGPTLLQVGPIGCPETSARNYHCSLPNYPDESSSHVWS